MKRVLFIVTVMVLINAKGLCSELVVPHPVLRSFETKFSEAQSIHWSFQNRLFKVEFALEDQSYFAFYNATGKLVGVGKNVAVLQLPLLAQKNLKLYFQNKWLTSLFVLEEKGGTSYYAVIENAGEKFYYKSVNHTWQLFMKRVK